MNKLPVIGILLGDAAGIGPEIVVRLLANGFLSSHCRPVLIGDRRVLLRAADVSGVADTLPPMPVATDTDGVARLLHDGAPLVLFDQQDTDPAQVPFGQLSEMAGRACVRMMDLGVALCRDGLLEGFSFAPFNKTALLIGGSDQPSELEYMARAFGLSRGYCEINVLDGIWSTRVTSHVPIADVSRAITVEAVLEAIRLANDTVLRTGKAPRLGVSALNPHAGENGHCGREEIDVIAPAIEAAQGLGIDATGPWPADTVFVRAFGGQFDAVVTMYHDQGQIALKMRGFERGAAVDGGLPYPITTCTHGTAFDIAGQGKAWTTAFESAVRIVATWRRTRVREGLEFLHAIAAWLAGAFLLASLIGFAVMGADKSRARRNRWRIPERTLLLLAAIGGAAGVLLGMRVFRHKTHHPRFTVVVPLLLFLQAVILVLALVG